MTDTVLTLTQIENLFQSITSQILNVTDPSIVRIGWSQDGAPAWRINDDICFLLVNYADTPITRQFETSYDATTETLSQSSIQAIRVAWTLYGPGSFDNANLIRSNLFQQTYQTQFSANNLALVTDVTMPTRVPELFNGQWWNQTSFYAQFNELVIRQTSVPYLTSADVEVLEG